MHTAEQTCQSFLDALASKAPVPGGGGASALVGALGTALCTMVGNYTVGKEKYAEVEEDVKALMAKAEDIRARLLALVDTDAEAFEPLSKAYTIPKDDPLVQAVRAQVDELYAQGRNTVMGDEELEIMVRNADVDRYERLLFHKSK